MNILPESYLQIVIFLQDPVVQKTSRTMDLEFSCLVFFFGDSVFFVGPEGLVLLLWPSVLLMYFVCA